MKSGISFVRNSGAKSKDDQMAFIGHARVSTDGQTLDAQVAELKSAGVVTVFQEKVSGAVAARIQLGRAIKALAPDDVLVVTRLDRLARSTRDLLNTLAAVDDAGAGFKSLRDTWADTTTPHGRLMLTILAGLAAIAITREPDAVGNVALELFAEAVSGCQGHPGTAERFFGLLIKQVAAIGARSTPPKRENFDSTVAACQRSAAHCSRS
jgi:Resolvase, N terminal domain